MLIYPNLLPHCSRRYIIFISSKDQARSIAHKNGTLLQNNLLGMRVLRAFDEAVFISNCSRDTKIYVSNWSSKWDVSNTFINLFMHIIIAWGSERNGYFQSNRIFPYLLQRGYLIQLIVSNYSQNIEHLVSEKWFIWYEVNWVHSF